MGGLHLLFYFRQKTRKTDLSFGTLAVLVGAYAGLCAGLYSSDTVAEGSVWLQWQLAMLPVMGVAFLWFVGDYTGLVGKKLLTAGGILFAILALVGILNPAHLVVSTEPLIKEFQFLWKGTITYYESKLGPIGFVQLALVQINYLFLFGVSLVHMGKVGAGRAAGLVIALGLFVLSGIVDLAVMFGLFESLYTIEYAFIGLVILMAYSHSSDLRESVKANDELQITK
jgi:hypothetical protein